MGHSHIENKSTSIPPESAAELKRKTTILLCCILIPFALLTILGIAALWPHGEKEDFSDRSPYQIAAGTQIFTGKIESIKRQNCFENQNNSTETGIECLIAQTLLDNTTDIVPVRVQTNKYVEEKIQAGDKIRILALDSLDDNTNTQYIFIDFIRGAPIALLAIAYASIVVLVAKWRGLRALIGLIFSYIVLTLFTLPALFAGQNPILVAILSAIAIMFVVLYFAHGFSAKTSTALLGTLCGLSVTYFLSWWGASAAHLYGDNDDNMFQIMRLNPNISLSGILICGFIISGLGILNDVTITQSSAVWELYHMDPKSSTKRLFTGGMRIGKDHIASTVYTIAFAYIGAALPIIMLVYIYQRPLSESLTSGELAEEVVRTLISSIGLVLAIPITTLIAVLVVKAVGSPHSVIETENISPKDSSPIGNQISRSEYMKQKNPQRGIKSLFSKNKKTNLVNKNASINEKDIG